MDKDKNNKKADENQQPMEYQQFSPGPPGSGPGRPPRPPGPGRPPTGPGPGRPPTGPGPGRPPTGPGPGRPGGQPPSAPPNFTPRLPRDQERQMQSGPTGFRGPGGGIIIDSRSRDFRGCMNRFTYIWLINGNNFWFYPVSAGRNTIEGFRWRRNRWEYDRIFTNRILFHLCF